jgi:hypothetical protein
VAVQPATISRAISVPAVGEPFAIWITISAILLVFGVFWLSQFYRRIGAQIASPSRYLARMMTYGAPAIVLLQALSGVGMYMLSSYRFPHHHELHMTGSFLFFISQALVVVIGTLQCDALLKDRANFAALARAGAVSYRMVLLRKRLGQVVIAMSLIYVCLFKMKDVDLDTMNTAIYAAYTMTEPLLITMFLVFLGLFQTDLLTLRRMAQLSS